MRPLIRSLLNCRKGVTALEFGFIAPLLVMTVIGVVELGLILFASAVLEGGMRGASRFGLTGYAPAGISREARVTQILTNSLGRLVTPGSLDFSQTVYRSFADIGLPEPFSDNSPANGTYDAGESFVDVNGNGKWDPDMGLAGVGGPGDVVVYTATLHWHLLTPMFAHLFGGGVVPLTASIVVRNEPFPGA